MIFNDDDDNDDESTLFMLWILSISRDKLTVQTKSSGRVQRIAYHFNRG